MTAAQSTESAVATAKIRQIWPLLAVSDLARSIEFYRDQLGFQLAEEAKANGQIFWCRLERDGACLMLQQACEEDGPSEGRGRGVTFYLVCNDADLVHAELHARGWQLAAPTLAYYGMKQLFVREPDGYSLCFESPTAKDLN